MQAAYQVRLKNKAGALVAVFTQDNLLSLRLTRRVNDVAIHELTLNADDSRVSLFVVDGQLEVWRRPAGHDWQLEYEGFHRNAEWQQDSDGRETFVSQGVGYQDLLRRRIIAAYAGSSEADKSGKAEAVAKAYVGEQIVSPAIGERAISGFTVQADGGSGNTVAVARAYRNLLEVLQEIAVIGGGDFDVIGTGAAEWEFRWYDGQRGADRRAQIVFATDYGNMLTPALKEQAARANTVLVLGQGEGSDRTWVWRPSATDVEGLDRLEVARDARDTDDTDILEDRGDAELYEGRTLDELSFAVVQVAGVQYGVDYGLGDLVSARYRSTDYDLKIVEVDLRLGAPDQIEVKFASI